jgi:L-fuculokinase
MSGPLAGSAAGLAAAARAEGLLDLVLDIGKTRTKLMVLDAGGEVLHAADHASQSREQAGYLALDSDALQAWLTDALAALGPLRGALGQAIVSAHGAAFAIVDDQGLVLPVPDYEFAGFDHRPADWADRIGSFDETLSPELPRGLNGATQLDWLARQHPGAFARGCLMPYAQYWAWWLSGQAATEVSALGCHTHLWNPTRGGYSTLAQRSGWAQRFAPMRAAWEVLGPVRPGLADRLGLPRNMRVHVGVHDSNACLARYLGSHDSPHPGSHLGATSRMTLVSSGTWTVVMATGAQASPLSHPLSHPPSRPLLAERDMLGNVSVLGQLVPTGRFMGGRELQQLCAGAEPGLATEAALQAVLRRGVLALPGFEAQGGPFRERPGRVLDASGQALPLAALPPAQRATLAALYCAQVTAWLIDQLGGAAPVVVEGPLARNPVYPGALAALLPGAQVQVSTDALEGTARGAWRLLHWATPAAAPAPLSAVQPSAPAGLAAYHARWLSELA